MGQRGSKPQAPPQRQQGLQPNSTAREKEAQAAANSKAAANQAAPAAATNQAAAQCRRSRLQVDELPGGVIRVDGMARGSLYAQNCINCSRVTNLRLFKFAYFDGHCRLMPFWVLCWQYMQHSECVVVA